MSEDYVSAIVDIIRRVEPNLDVATIRQVADSVLVNQPLALRVLMQLTGEPGLLTSGSSTVPRAISRLMFALVEQGASRVRLPRCEQCNHERPLPHLYGDTRICGSCWRESRRVEIVCTECRKVGIRQVRVGEREFCKSCWILLRENAIEIIQARIQSILPGVAATQILDAITAVQTNQPRDRLSRLAAECLSFAGEWFELPSKASFLFARFHDALRAVGVTLVERVCGRCQQVTTLNCRLNGVICCRKCYREGTLSRCDGCGQERSIERVQPDGARLCQRCTNSLDDENAECSNCGNYRLIAARTSSGPVCSMCRFESRVDVCTSCHKELPCRFAVSDKAICADCQRARSLDVCRVCGHSRVCRFAGTERAVCNQCANLREPCMLCGLTRPIRQRSSDGRARCWACVPKIIEQCAGCHAERVVNGRVEGRPYCLACYPLQPASFRDCLRCGRHEHLSQAKLCIRCTADDLIASLFSDHVLTTHPRMGALKAACQNSPPDRVVRTFRSSASLEMLRQLLVGTEEITHQAIDDAGPERNTRTVRAFLVENGLLPHRDEVLARMEKWISQAAHELHDAKERAAFTQFARWRHLRHLRQQREPSRQGQVDGRIRELQQVISLIKWSHEIGGCLSALRQADVDKWIDADSVPRRLVRQFLLWTKRNGHTVALTAPAVAIGSITPRGLDEQARWRLLNDVLSSPSKSHTKLAAALVLLYGIRAATIVQLRVEDLFSDDGGEIGRANV